MQVFRSCLPSVCWRPLQTAVVLFLWPFRTNKPAASLLPLLKSEQELSKLNKTTKVIERSLDIDNLQEGQIKMEVEEIGEVDLKTYLDKFNGSYVKISISDKTEE